MRYEVRARHARLADYMVLIDTDSLPRAITYRDDFTGLLPNMDVWLYDTQENARVDDTAGSDTHC